MHSEIMDEISPKNFDTLRVPKISHA